MRVASVVETIHMVGRWWIFVSLKIFWCRRVVEDSGLKSSDTTCDFLVTTTHCEREPPSIASVNMSRPGQVKNRAPAPIQISAEQILREAADRQEQHVVDPIVKIHDAEEYQAFLRDRRKYFEDNIRYRREHIGNWVKYARFEEDNKEFERSRSIYERALEVDHRSGELWLRYAEFEMRNEFINHARNILDRAVQILPRVDFLWYKYVYMEEMVGDTAKCRAIFQRWMEWQPDDNGWLSFARFETRCNQLERAEKVMRQYVNTYPSARAFLRFAKWAEFEAHDVPLARTIYEASLSELEPEESHQARVFRQFAVFEERQGEYERARVIYKHAIALLNLEPSLDGSSRISNDDSLSENERKKREELYQTYITFEKKHGNRRDVEDAVLTKQRTKYRQRLQADPYDYDGWFELATLEEEHGDVTTVRDTYERAVANVPPSTSIKDHWRRYVYLWIYYAVFEELVSKDLDRAAEVYSACLSIIPHKEFSFAKIWIYAAKLQVRRHDLAAARKLFGKAIGLCGKEKIYSEYISLELALGEVERCRKIYGNYLKAMPYNCKTWSKYADLEKSVGETERCRAIYELAISQTALDMPELLWKAYIDFEIEEGEGAKARTLYTRLLEKTGHVKVWVSYAQFESTPIGLGIEKSREIFEKAYDQLREDGLSEERVLLLDAWRVLEKAQGTQESVASVEAKMPRRVKRKRIRTDDEGNELGWEEYFDYQFPEDAVGAAAGNFKILEMAAKWKEQMASARGADSDSDSDEDDNLI
jgi:crooked neck